MDRFRFGLGGLGGPLTERKLYGDAPKERRFERYAQVFSVLECHFTADPGFTAADAETVMARSPLGLTLVPRLSRRLCHGAPDPGELERWVNAVEPLLRSASCGPIYVPWEGPPGPDGLADLESLLGALWPRLRARHRVAVEFRDAAWMRATTFQALEEHGALAVWSTTPGLAPHRITGDAVYIRLTGAHRRRFPDEVMTFVEGLRARPNDRRPVFVVGAHATDPYALGAVERFATLVGRPIQWTPTFGPVATQSDLASWAV